MGFGIRIAPGVRVTASSRGLRTGIGPRIARVHVGAGKTGVSTGAGPVTYFTTGPRATRSSRRATSVPDYERHVRAARRSQEIEAVAQLDDKLAQLAAIHRVDFPPAKPPSPAEMPQVDEGSLRSAAVAAELRGVPLLRRSMRLAARQVGAQKAEREIAQAHERAKAEQDRQTAELQRAWEQLVQNDPQMVLSALETAFEDNMSPAAAVNVDGSLLDVVMYWPEIDAVVGERKAVLTPTGRPTHHKRSMTERNALYLAALGSNVLATVKESLAVAPGLDQARILVVMHRQGDSDRGIDALFAGQFSRAALDGYQWNQLDPRETLLELLPDAKLNLKGRTKAVEPIELSDDPELSRVLEELARSLTSTDANSG